MCDGAELARLRKAMDVHATYDEEMDPCDGSPCSLRIALGTTDPTEAKPCQRCGGCGCQRSHSGEWRDGYGVSHSGVCPDCDGSGRTSDARSEEVHDG